MNSLTFGTHTDGRNESENSALKKFGIHPRSKLSSIYRADTMRQAIRTITCERIENYVESTVPLMNCQHLNLTNETIETLNMLNDAAYRLTMKILECSTEYYCIKVSNDLYHVMSKDISTEYNYEVVDKDSGKKVTFTLPRFNRVREIKTFHDAASGQYHCKCSCNYTIQWAMPCRHIVFLNQQQLDVQQFNIRWMKVFQHVPLNIICNSKYCAPKKLHVDNEQRWLQSVAPPDELIQEPLGANCASEKDDDSNSSASTNIEMLNDFWEDNHRVIDHEDRHPYRIVQDLCRKIFEKGKHFLNSSEDLKVFVNRANNLLETLDNDMKQISGQNDSAMIVDNAHIPVSVHGKRTNCRFKSSYERMSQSSSSDNLIFSQTQSIITHIGEPIIKRGKGRPRKE
jgi:hypothetical protein